MYIYHILFDIFVNITTFRLNYFLSLLVIMKKILFLSFLFSLLFISYCDAAYTSEEKSVYTWAFNNWITSMATIDKADMKWEVTRIELAKMISNYAVKTLKKKGDTSKECVFTDVTSDLDLQYDKWVTNACQLWLMWQWITKFRPYDKVTRAEFWTILSRLLYWNKFDWWNPYYQKHLLQLKSVWIMTNILYPDRKNESRGNVMLMLKRSKEWWVESINTTNFKIPSYDELSQETSFSCVYEPVFDGEEPYDYFLSRKDLIIPYKDWYFGYDYRGQAGIWFYVYYRLLSDICNPYIVSDDIFRLPAHGRYDFYNKIYHNNFFSYYNDDDVAKILDCDPKDQAWCYKEADKYMYNLLVWIEYDEFFSLWMDELKRRIDSHQVKTVIEYYNYAYDDQTSLLLKCIDETKNEFLSKISSVSWYNLECINWIAAKYCRYEYINACANWYDCKKIKSEFYSCKDS